MSGEQRAWQRPRPAGAGAGAGARNSQSRSSTASPNQQNVPAKATPPAPPANVWAEKAQERSRSAAQKSGTNTRDGSASTRDGARKAQGNGAGATAAATASPQVSSATPKPQSLRPGLSTKEIIDLMKQGSLGIQTYRVAEPEDGTKSRKNNLMANGQDFFVELSKQGTQPKAKNNKKQ